MQSFTKVLGIRFFLVEEIKSVIQKSVRGKKRQRKKASEEKSVRGKSVIQKSVRGKKRQRTTSKRAGIASKTFVQIKTI
jgi:hypothetical protein